MENLYFRSLFRIILYLVSTFYRTKITFCSDLVNRSVTENELHGIRRDIIRKLYKKFDCYIDMLSSGQTALSLMEAYVILNHDLPICCLYTRTSRAKPRSHGYYRYYSTLYVSFFAHTLFERNRIFILRKLGQERPFN